MLCEEPVSGSCDCLPPSVLLVRGEFILQTLTISAPNASAVARMALHSPPFLPQGGRRNEKAIGLFSLTSVGNFVSHNIRSEVEEVN